HPLFGIGGEVVEDLLQFEMRIRMQRVVHFRTRQRHGRDRALARDYRKFQIHVCSPRLFSVAWNVCCDTSLLAASRATQLRKAPARAKSYAIAWLGVACLGVAFSSYFK